MAIGSDFSVSLTGDIRHVSGTATYTCLDLHAWLQSLSANLVAAGDDLLSIQSQNPSKLDGLRSGIKPMSLNLLNGFNIDDDGARYFNFGSISQAGGDALYVTIKSIGSPLVAASPIYITQSGSKLTKYWDDGHIQVMVKAKAGGALIDSGNAMVWSRKYGQTYANFGVNLVAGGEQLAAITTSLTDWTPLSLSSALALSSKVALSVGDMYHDTGDGNGSKLYKGTIALSGGITVAEAAQYLQAICAEGSAATVVGVPGWRYMALDAGYAPNSAAPFGQVAGGKWFVAQGWLIAGALAQDSQKYQIVSHDGTVVSNPVVTVLTVGDLVVGSSVEVARDNGAGWIVTSEYTLSGDHASGVSAITIAEAIKPDTPVSGVIVVSRVPLAYTSFNAGAKTFAMASPTSQAFASGAAAYVPFIYRTAAGASESSSNFLFSSAFTARAVVRKATAPSRQEFNATFAVTAAGGSVNAIQNLDE